MIINKEEAQKYYYACALAQKIFNEMKDMIADDLGSYYGYTENNEWIILNANGLNDFSAPVTSDLNLYAKWTPLGFKKGMVGKRSNG